MIVYPHSSIAGYLISFQRARIIYLYIYSTCDNPSWLDEGPIALTEFHNSNTLAVKGRALLLSMTVWKQTNTADPKIKVFFCSCSILNSVSEIQFCSAHWCIRTIYPERSDVDAKKHRVTVDPEVSQCWTICEVDTRQRFTLWMRCHSTKKGERNQWYEAIILLPVGLDIS